jgi:hypothetical protein
MRKTIWFAVLLSFAATLQARPDPPLSRVAALLFKDVRTKLSVAEKNAIAADTGFVLTGDAAQPFALDEQSREHPFSAEVLPTDMNADGREEIFIVFGNTYTSGMTGSSVDLYIRNAEGRYTNQFGFPGLVPDALEEKRFGYPDLVIGGPGLEYPVWRWDGRTYLFGRMITDADYGGLRKEGIDELSQAYQLTIDR